MFQNVMDKIAVVLRLQGMLLAVFEKIPIVLSSSCRLIRGIKVAR
jgi:hypothetical protein